MRRPCRKMNLDERRILAAMLQAKATKTKIAEVLGRDRSISTSTQTADSLRNLDGIFPNVRESANLVTPARPVIECSPWKQVSTTVPTRSMTAVNLAIGKAI